MYPKIFRARNLTKFGRGPELAAAYAEDNIQYQIVEKRATKLTPSTLGINVVERAQFITHNLKTTQATDANQVTKKNESCTEHKQTKHGN